MQQAIERKRVAIIRGFALRGERREPQVERLAAYDFE